MDSPPCDIAETSRGILSLTTDSLLSATEVQAFSQFLNHAVHPPATSSGGIFFAGPLAWKRLVQCASGDVPAAAFPSRVSPEVAAICMPIFHPPAGQASSGVGHWTGVILLPMRREILYLDSLAHYAGCYPPPADLARVLTWYAKSVLHGDFGPEDFRVTCVGHSTTMPMQTNHYDCGIFMFYNFISHALHYVCEAPLITYQESDCLKMRKQIVHCCITGAPLPSWLVPSQHRGLVDPPCPAPSWGADGIDECPQQNNVEQNRGQRNEDEEPHFDIQVICN